MPASRQPTAFAFPGNHSIAPRKSRLKAAAARNGRPTSLYNGSVKLRLTLALIGLQFASTATLLAPPPAHAPGFTPGATSPPPARVQSPPAAPANPNSQQSINERGFTD